MDSGEGRCRNCGSVIIKPHGTWVHKPNYGGDSGWKYCENHRTGSPWVSSGPIAQPITETEVVTKILDKYGD